LEQQPERRIAQLQKENEQVKAKIQWYEEQIRLGKQRQYGASSEKTPAEQRQFTDLLGNEAEMEADPKREEPTVETITCQRRKSPGNVRPSFKICPWRSSNITCPQRSRFVRAATGRSTP
jgi:transposase